MRRATSKTKNPGARDNPWAQWRRLEDFFDTGQVAVIDGANGTEIQRLGGKPAETFSSGTSALCRPDICRETHELYLEAGADIIITHSYSSNRNVMANSGNGDRVCECILSAAAIARRATAMHIGKHASDLARAAASAHAAAAQAAEAAATNMCRTTTSYSSNLRTHQSAEAAVEAGRAAQELSEAAGRAMQEMNACAAAAAAAATAALAASEGEPLPEPTKLPNYPEPVPTKGWDAAGFGPAIVVGSLSTHPPEMPAGTESSKDAKWPDPEQEQKNYSEAAEAHGLSGVDMLWLEMMKNHDHAPRAAKAAAACGLPVFLGISARTDRNTGETVMWGTGEDAIPLTPAWFHNLVGILGKSLVGVNVMHTNFSTMREVLKFVREDCGWTGPLGAYADHGEFKAPEWVFRELDNAEAIEQIKGWIRDYNVQLVGGCCGTGPSLIQAISAFCRHHNAEVREHNKRENAESPRLESKRLKVN